LTRTTLAENGYICTSAVSRFTGVGFGATHLVEISFDVSCPGPKAEAATRGVSGMRGPIWLAGAAVMLARVEATILAEPWQRPDPRQTLHRHECTSADPFGMRALAIIGAIFQS